MSHFSVPEEVSCRLRRELSLQPSILCEDVSRAVSQGQSIIVSARIVPGSGSKSQTSTTRVRFDHGTLSRYRVKHIVCDVADTTQFKVLYRYRDTESILYYLSKPSFRSLAYFQASLAMHICSVIPLFVFLVTGFASPVESMLQDVSIAQHDAAVQETQSANACHDHSEHHNILKQFPHALTSNARREAGQILHVLRRLLCCSRVRVLQPSPWHPRSKRPIPPPQSG
jgi:hypothetical protein